MSFQITEYYKLDNEYNGYLDFALNLLNSSLNDHALKVLVKEEINIENSLSNAIISVLKLDYFSKIRLSNHYEIQEAYNKIELFYSKQENKEFDYSQCKLKLNALLLYDNVIKSDFYTNLLEPKFKLRIENYIISLRKLNNIIENSSLVDGDFENELLFYESYYNEKPQLNESYNSEHEYYHSSFLKGINNDIYPKIDSYIRIEKILNQYLLQSGKNPYYQFNPKKQINNRIFHIEKNYSKNNKTNFVNQN